MSINLNQNIRHGVAWLLAGNTGNQVLAFAFGIVLARMLAPEVFGMLVVIQIYTGLVGLVAGGGMGQALVRAKEADERQYNAVFSVQLFIGILIYTAFFLFAPVFARWHGDALYQDLLRVAALSFPLRPFVNLPSNILHRQMRFKALAVLNVTILFFSSGVSIAMAFFGFGVWSLIFGGLSGSIAASFILLPLARWRPRLTLEWSYTRDLVRYGMLTSIGDLIVYFRGQVANFILSRTLGAHFLGLFNKANSLAAIPNMQITGSVYHVTFRALAKDQTNINVNKYLYLRSITLVAAYTWPLFLALAWLAEPLIRVLYGEKWIGAAAPLTCLAIAGPFLMLEMLAGCVLAARNWLDKEIPIQIIQTIVLALGVLGGLPYGLTGVAIGATLANVYGAVHLTWLASRCLSMPLRRIGVSLLSPLFLSTAVLLLWATLDYAGSPYLHTNDVFYLLLMLGAGGLLFVVLFLFAPLADIASEKARWLALLRRRRLEPDPDIAGAAIPPFELTSSANGSQSST